VSLILLCGKFNCLKCSIILFGHHQLLELPKQIKSLNPPKKNKILMFSTVQMISVRKRIWEMKYSHGLIEPKINHISQFHKLNKIDTRLRFIAPTFNVHVNYLPGPNSEFKIISKLLQLLCS
jgi:hypothetical protein